MSYFHSQTAQQIPIYVFYFNKFTCFWFFKLTQNLIEILAYNSYVTEEKGYGLWMLCFCAMTGHLFTKTN